MKKIIKLTEQDLTNIVRKVLVEQRVSSLIQGKDSLCLIKCKQKIAANGSDGDGVQEIQHLLAKLGFFKGEGGGMNPDCAKNPQSCDGKFRKRTKQAVEEFQGSEAGKACGLKIDGIVGFNTLECLDKQHKINRQCDCEKIKKDQGTEIENLTGKNCKEKVEGYLKINSEQIFCCIHDHLIKTAPDHVGFMKCLEGKKSSKKINETECPKYVDCTDKKSENYKFCLSEEIVGYCTQKGTSYTWSKK